MIGIGEGNSVYVKRIILYNGMFQLQEELSLGVYLFT